MCVYVHTRALRVADEVARGLDAPRVRLVMNRHLPRTAKDRFSHYHHQRGNAVQSGI